MAPYREWDGGILIPYLVLLKIKPMQTLMKNNERGGLSRNAAASVGNESIIYAFISLVNSFLTGLLKARHELRVLKPKQPHSALCGYLISIW